MHPLYHIIVNPASRSGRGHRIWVEDVEPCLQKRHIPYRSYFSGQAGEVARLAAKITKEASERPIHLIVLGGDGTVNEALQGIENLSDVILGYIPTGSSNDLARDLGIPKDPGEALDLILASGNARPLDLGRLTYDNDASTRLFAVSTGIGFDAATCEEAMNSRIKDTLNKLGLGKLTYLGIALKQLIGAKKVSCTLTLYEEDGTAREISLPRFLFIAGMNHRYEGGGFQFCPDAVDADGYLNLCVVGNLSKALILLALPTAFFGKHYVFHGIDTYRTRRYHLSSSAPLWVHTDGEVTRRSDGFTVECLPSAVQMILRD